MQLHLTRSERTSGMLIKKTEYVVHARIELTPEEAKIVEKTKLGDYQFVEFEYKGVDLSPSVSRMIGGTGVDLPFADILEANEMEAVIKGSCQNFKNAIEGALSGTEKEEVIEF